MTKRVAITEKMAEWASLDIFAQAQADNLKPLVRGYQGVILKEFEFFTDTGERIFDPERSWEIVGDEKAQEYYDLCDQAKALAGFDLPAGYCPYLIAQHIHGRVRTRLLEASIPSLKEIGINSVPTVLEIRERLAELLIGAIAAEKMILDAPTVRELATKTTVAGCPTTILIPRKERK